MAGKSFTFTVPLWTANLLSNLVGLLGLVTVCVMLAFLTDWRWGGLLAGMLLVVVAGWMQMQEQPEAKPLRKAA